MTEKILDTPINKPFRQAAKTALVATTPATSSDIALPYGLDANDFWADMDDWDATDEQKLEWLHALAHIVKGFVDLGLGIESTQMMLAQNFVDKSALDSPRIPQDSSDMLQLNRQKTPAQDAAPCRRKEGLND